MAEWISPLPLTLVIDLFFFVAILFLLQQLNRKLTRKSRVVDAEVLDQFRALLGESQVATDRFVTVITEEVRTLQRLVRQLDEKEKAMVALLEAAEACGEKGTALPADPPPPSDRNAEILQLVRQGVSRETISQRTGFTDGEIELVIALDRAGRDHR